MGPMSLYSMNPVRRTLPPLLVWLRALRGLVVLPVKVKVKGAIVERVWNRSTERPRFTISSTADDGGVVKVVE